MAGGGGGGGADGGGGDHQTAGHDMAATVPQEFVEWGYPVSRGDGEEVGTGKAVESGIRE